MKIEAGRRPTTRRSNYALFLVTFLLAASALAVPLFSADSSSPAAKALHDDRQTKSQSGAIPISRFLRSSAVIGETVEVLAADCVTPKTTFTFGETVCAKTDGVDLTVPNNHYMNWIDSQANQTNGGTITQNPQYFTFVPPTMDTWKATIGRVTPADSSIIGNPPLFTVGPGIGTYDATCTTPKTTFELGDTVCARAYGLAGFRFAWIDPAGFIRERTDITTSPQDDTFALPSDPTTTIDGFFVVDNRGTWRVNAITSRGSSRTGTFFTVTDPQNPAADVSIFKTYAGGDAPAAGDAVAFSVTITNNGPDDAVNVHFIDDTFSGATFVSVNQDSGPQFTCTGSGSADCTTALMPAGGVAKFTLLFTAGSAGSVINNKASVTSDTTELNSGDNTSESAPLTVRNAPSTTCVLDCPANVVAVADTEENNVRGAHVSYDPPTEAGTCGTVTYDIPSGSFFPVGDTLVTATSTEGDGSCSFFVTVEDTSNTTISCPADQSGTADANCEAIFSLGTATGTGSNVTVIAFRSDGKPVYTCDEFGNCDRNGSDPGFSVGTSTVTWIAYSHDIPGPYDAQTGDEESHRTGSASCTQTIFVEDVTPPAIGATDETIPADASCQAAVPDYRSTVTDNCACDSSDTAEECEGHEQIAYSQNPAPGTMLAPGTYTVHIEASDGTNSATKDISLTVADQTAPTINCPANVVTTTAAGTCSATVDPGTATANDNCDSSPTIVGTRSDSQPLNAPYPIGTTTITWRATDDAGNYSECEQTVTVNDEEPPTISCPADITVSNDPGECGAVVTYTTPVGQDNCAGANTVQTAGLPSGSQFPVGTTTNTFEVTDASGNKTSCSFTVTVNDVENPVISCPANIVLEPTCPSGAIASWTEPVGTDNCPGAVTTRTAGPAPGSTFAAGTTTTISYTVNDAHGHSASCSFTVTVKSVLQTIDDLRASVAANQQLTGPQRNGLLSKLDAAKGHIQNGNQNGACSKLADFVNSVQNFINHGDVSATTGNAWISTANNIRNAIGCTNNPCT